MRLNRDATIFGTNPNGVYTFRRRAPLIRRCSSLPPAASTTSSPAIRLPDSLTGLLTATPYSYAITAAASVTPDGDKFDEAAVRREAYNFYFQDTWKVNSPR